MKAKTCAGLGMGGLLAALATGCLSWGDRTAYESVTLYIAYADMGLPLSDATIELADGSREEWADPTLDANSNGVVQEEMGAFLDAERDAGRLLTGLTNDQGQLTVRFNIDQSSPLTGPLIMRFKGNGNVGKAFAVGLIEGATTIVQGPTDEAVSVMVVNIEITSPYIN